jgi:hypothetical protein
MTWYTAEGKIQMQDAFEMIAELRKDSYLTRARPDL